MNSSDHTVAISVAAGRGFYQASDSTGGAHNADHYDDKVLDANGNVYPADLCVWAAGIRAPEMLGKLGLQTARGGGLDVAPLAALCDVAEAHDAWMMVDDAHGFGVLGEQGAGTPAAQQVAARIPGARFGCVEVRPVAQDLQTLRALGFETQESNC